ncbi:S26 family signal peptidase [Halorubrum sp. CBA1229]|uniref:S26 family signal peptidase n=1 Tax=Halorubrum sp. CBA1229 TaxID=1853699 RepID=UPI000F3B6A60|nr:S26 family signal peptidase [Halorubrum sp. CBA1229]QKY16618.1 S26 family signal peptidase [Halorubrum sp. CBA1229]
MDEGDRPETDGDPAERSGASGASGDDRDETDSVAASESADASKSTDDPEPVDDPERTDGTEQSNRSGQIDEPDPIDTPETVEPSEGGGVSGDDDRGSGFAERTREGPAPTETKGLAYRFRHDKEGALMWIREMLSSVAIVLVIGLILFGISGVWPPMVAVESGSMEPNMEVGDLVFVTEPGRLAPDAANNDVGVVTYEDGRAADYRTFGSYGSVVIYRPPGRTASPIIHRAMFHVEEGENWYDRADDEYHGAAGCADLRHCPAPHDGFITLGDNNGAYDQANGLAPPVKAEWVTGVARVRVPYLGYVRLIASGQAELSDVLATTVAAEAVDRVGETEDSAAASDEFSKPTVSGGGSIASASA